MGSSLVAWVLIATRPISLARNIQAFSRSSVRTVSYLPRSILPAFAEARCAAASPTGVRLLSGSPLLRGAGGGANRSPLPNAGRPVLGAAGAAGGALSPDESLEFAS